MDETTLSLHPPLRCCWMKRGQQQCIDTPGQQWSIHYFGGYDWQTDQVHGVYHARRNSEGFCLFLEHLMTDIYPNDQVV